MAFFVLKQYVSKNNSANVIIKFLLLESSQIVLGEQLGERLTKCSVIINMLNAD